MGIKNRNMTFNGEQLSAIVHLAKCMAAADGKVLPKELTVIANELARFGVFGNATDAILTASDAMNGAQSIAIVSAMNSEQKKYVCAYLGSLMAIDGDIDDNEMQLWSLTTALCDLPEMNAAQALQYMANL